MRSAGPAIADVGLTSERQRCAPNGLCVMSGILRFGARFVVGLAIALLALVAMASAASASEPGDWDSQVDSDSSISGAGSDLSGVAIDDNGRIYGVDNGLLEVQCLSKDAAGEWTARSVGAFTNNEDTEGITSLGGGDFLVAWEDQTGSTLSGATTITISSGLSFTIGTSNSLAPIAEISGLNTGGAEGIAHLGGTEFLVVQEGVGTPAVPKLFKLDTSNGAVTFLFDLAGISDAAGVAVEPGDPGSAWVLSEASDKIVKYDLMTGVASATSIDLSAMFQPEGLAFAPDGASLVVVGEAAEILTLQRSGNAGNPAPPAGICNDDLASASVIQLSPSTTTGFNLLAAPETIEPSRISPDCVADIDATVPGATVWYSWTPATSGTVFIDTIGSDFDTVLAVYSGPATNPTFGGLVELACTDNVAGVAGPSGLPLAVTAGNTYYIQVDGYSGATGQFNLNMSSVVADTTAPVLSVPADVSVQASGASGAVVTFVVSASDVVDGSLTPVCSPVSGSMFGVGVTTVTCSATDVAGNAGSDTFVVTVVDATAPVLSVPADVSVQATGAAGAVVTFLVSASDVVDGSLTPVCSPVSGSMFGVGVTTVTCSATDAAANTGSDTFEVIVTPADAFCLGKLVTINMNTNGGDGTGTDDDDVILGTPGDDVIDAGAGNDTVCAGDGDDVVAGGDGDDVVVGGDGDDTIFGDGGSDVLRGNAGVDRIDGGAGNDRVLGGIGGDTLIGGDGDDYLGGFGGADTIDGGPGNETIFGGFGADAIDGGPGDDVIRGLIGDDIINGGDGNDSLFGDRGNDIINGGNGNDVIQGGNANDTINGDAGDDDVSGGRADDTLSGGAGNDKCTGNKQHSADTADETCDQIFGVP